MIREYVEKPTTVQAVQYTGEESLDVIKELIKKYSGKVISFEDVGVKIELYFAVDGYEKVLFIGVGDYFVFRNSVFVVMNAAAFEQVYMPYQEVSVGKKSHTNVFNSKIAFDGKQ